MERLLHELSKVEGSHAVRVSLEHWLWQNRIDFVMARDVMACKTWLRLAMNELL